MKLPTMPRPRLLAALLTVAALLLTGCTDEVTFEPVGSVDTVLTTTSEDVRIGVLVSTQGPGAAALGPAHGALVAAARFNDLSAGGPVELVVEDDLGSTAGAEAAVDALVEAGVIGIVHASVGPQVAAAAARADAAGVPLLAPLATDGDAVDATTTAWLTGPRRELLAEAILAFDGVGPVLHLTPDATAVPSSAGVVTEVAVTGGLLAEQVGAEVAAQDPSTVVWWGDPVDALAVVAALQRADRLVPVVVGQDALLPTFGRALSEAAADAGLVATTPLYAPGPMPPSDAAATTRAFEAARDLVARRGLPGLAGASTDDPAADLATADARVHDAVLDLVAALDAAASPTADAVVEALRKGGEVPGRVTPRPDYGSSQTPFPSERVVLFQSSGLASVDTLTAPAAGPVLGWSPTSSGN